MKFDKKPIELILSLNGSLAGLDSAEFIYSKAIYLDENERLQFNILLCTAALISVRGIDPFFRHLKEYYDELP
jgi:hypothetical protein